MRFDDCPKEPDNAMKTSPGLRWLPILMLLAVITPADNPLHSEQPNRRVGPGEMELPFRTTTGLFDSSNLRTLGLESVKGTNTLLYQATDDGYKFCHHPNLILFSDRLYCMWSNGIVDEDAPGQRVLYSHSADGISWTKPALLTDDRHGKGICVAAGFHVSTDRLVAYYTTTGGENFHPDTSLMARTSQDGRAWSSPQRITNGFFIEGPHQLAQGRLLLGGEHVGESRRTRRMRFLYTDDQTGLAVWKSVQIDPPDLDVYGYTEPSFFLRCDGTVVATLRNYSGYLHACVSRDNGQTWTTPKQTNFPDSTARAAAGNLPDGTAYIINNPMPKQFDRSLLTIALSRDGVVFDRAYLIRSQPTQRRYDGKHKLDGWQYPHALVWEDTLYVAYSINKEDIGLTRIALTDISPRIDNGR